MNLYYIAPLLIGMFGILQGALVREMSMQIGLSQSLLYINGIIIVMTLSFFFLVKNSPESFPLFIQLKAPMNYWRWWYVFPAIMGFSVVAGLPLAIYKLGAVKVTVCLIAAQMLTSILWDLFVEKIPVNATKGLGMFFALLSVIFTVWR